MSIRAKMERIATVQEFIREGNLRWIEKLVLCLNWGIGCERQTLRNAALIIGRSYREADRIRASAMRKLRKFEKAQYEHPR